MAASTTASARFVFRSPYKGGTKEWSTRFHLTGGDWQDQAHFTTWCAAAWLLMRNDTPTYTTLVEEVAYNPGSEVPVYTVAVGEAGTYDTAALSHTPLETCLLLRFSTTQRSTKNHPIYLFNYIHGLPMNAADEPETPRADNKAAWLATANSLVAGINDGTIDRMRAGPRGAVAQSAFVEEYFTHRDFPA